LNALKLFNVIILLCLLPWHYGILLFYLQRLSGQWFVNLQYLLLMRRKNISV